MKILELEAKIDEVRESIQKNTTAYKKGIAEGKVHHEVKSIYMKVKAALKQLQTLYSQYSDAVDEDLKNLIDPKE